MEDERDFGLAGDGVGGGWYGRGPRPGHGAGETALLRRDQAAVPTALLAESPQLGLLAGQAPGAEPAAGSPLRHGTALLLSSRSTVAWHRSGCPGSGSGQVQARSLPRSRC